MMKEKLKTESEDNLDAAGVDDVIAEPVCVTFTKAESAVIMALIRSGWSTAVLGSRKGFELLARVEDEMRAAGAVDNELPPTRN